MYCLTTFLSLAFLVGQTVCNTKFTNPGDQGAVGIYRNNPTYSEGADVPVSWTTDLANVTLYVYEDWPDGNQDGTGYWYHTVDTDLTDKSTDWTVTLGDFNLTVPEGGSIVLFFTLFDHGNNQVASSSYFNVTVPEKYFTQTTTTTRTASATRTKATSTGSSTIVETTAAATTTQATDNSSSSKDLSSGAIAGIAVGSTIGGILVLAGLGFFIWKRYQKGDSSGKYTQGQQAPQEEAKPTNYDGGTWVYYPPAQNPPAVYEAPNERPAQEAPVPEQPKLQPPVEAP